MTDITIIRRQHDASLSVYRGQTWLGFVFCPVQGSPAAHADYKASPQGDRDAATFATEADAIAYLAA